MPFSINLRFDLKRLSDSEIASRFDVTASERETIILPPPPFAYHRATRDMFRHPAVYRACYVLNKSLAPGLFEILAAVGAFFNWFCVRRHILESKEARAYLLNCELLDLEDELKRRVRQRRGIAHEPHP